MGCTWWSFICASEEPAWWDGMSIREASRMFGVHRDTVRKMLEHPVAARIPHASSPAAASRSWRGSPRS